MEEKLVKVTRKFTYLLNIGNYQNVEFSCSQESESSQENVEKTSEILHDFCKEEVIKSLNAYKKENNLETPREKIIKELKEWFARGGDNGGPTQEQKQEIYNIISATDEIKAEESSIK